MQFQHSQEQIEYERTVAVLKTLGLIPSIQPYSAVAPIVGLHHRDPKFHRYLGRAMEADHNAGRSLSSSLVVNKKLGRPGGEYFEKARSLGYLIGPTPHDEQAFWQKQIQSLGL